MKKISEAIETIGMKKICLFAHYGLAIGTSLVFFILSVVGTFTPATIDITALTHIWRTILVYCAVVVAYITILCIFNDMQTMNKAKTKFDFIAFFIGFSMFVTLALIIVCIIFMFQKTLTELELKMWTTLIGIFGSMFGVEAGGGYIYNIFKKKFDLDVKKNLETTGTCETIGDNVSIGVETGQES